MQAGKARPAESTPHSMPVHGPALIRNAIPFIMHAATVYVTIDNVQPHFTEGYLHGVSGRVVVSAYLTDPGSGRRSSADRSSCLRPIQLMACCVPWQPCSWWWPHIVAIMHVAAYSQCPSPNLNLRPKPLPQQTQVSPNRIPQYPISRTLTEPDSPPAPPTGERTFVSGTVCADEFWDDNAATAVCKQLSLAFTSNPDEGWDGGVALAPGAQGNGSYYVVGNTTGINRLGDLAPDPGSWMPVVMNKVQCKENSWLLGACTYDLRKPDPSAPPLNATDRATNTTRTCTHALDAAVRCFRAAPPPPAPLGKWV